MQIIIKTDEEDKVKYILPDDCLITVKKDRIEVRGRDKEFDIGDMNSLNTLVKTVSSVPAEITGDEYKYKNSTFESNTKFRRLSVDGSLL